MSETSKSHTILERVKRILLREVTIDDIRSSVLETIKFPGEASEALENKITTFNKAVDEYAKQIVLNPVIWAAIKISMRDVSEQLIHQPTEIIKTTVQNVRTCLSAIKKHL